MFLHNVVREKMVLVFMAASRTKTWQKQNTQDTNRVDWDMFILFFCPSSGAKPFFVECGAAFQFARPLLL